MGKRAKLKTPPTSAEPPPSPAAPPPAVRPTGLLFDLGALPSIPITPPMALPRSPIAEFFDEYPVPPDLRECIPPEVVALGLSNFETWAFVGLMLAAKEAKDALALAMRPKRGRPPKPLDPDDVERVTLAEKDALVQGKRVEDILPAFVRDLKKEGGVGPEKRLKLSAHTLRAHENRLGRVLQKLRTERTMRDPAASKLRKQTAAALLADPRKKP